MRYTSMAMFLLLLPACHNACQALCDDIYDFGVEQCGAGWSKDDLKECYDAQSRGATDASHRKDCRNSDADVSDWWSCEDIDRYFDQLTSGTQGGDTAADGVN